MSKKKNANPMAKAVIPVAPRKTPARKPKVKAPSDSQLKKTILSAPRAIKLEAASSFMRTTAFTLQNKVRSAMTELSKVEKSIKTPSARLGLSYQPSMSTTSSESFFSKPFNRFKIALLTMVMIGGVGGYFYFDRVMDGFKSMGDAVSIISHEKSWVDGMLTQTNGISEGSDKGGALMPPRMMEETVIPVADEVPAAAATDVLTAEPMPASVSAAKVKAEAKTSKASKAVKKSKASKTKQAKAKAKGNSKTKVVRK